MSGQNRHQDQRVRDNLYRTDKTPQMPAKVYSFQDQMFESFGNGYGQKYENQKYKKPLLSTINNGRLFFNQNQQIAELADKVSLISSMFKISRKVFDHSILFINSKNKTKIETIVETNKNNEDEDSKILCQNTRKYLSLLDLVRSEQNSQDPLQDQILTFFPENRVKNNFESRVQQSLSTQLSSKNKKPYQNKQQDSYLLLINHASNNTQRKDAAQVKKNVQNSFLSHKHLNLHPEYQKDSWPGTNYQESQGTEEMFKQIETPKMHHNQNMYWEKKGEVPLHENFIEKVGVFSTVSQASGDRAAVGQAKRYKKFERSPQSQLQLQKSREKSNSLQKYKFTHKQFKQKSEVEKQKQKLRTAAQKKPYMIQKSYLQKGTTSNKKIKIEEDRYASKKSKNLALKVVDRTNQFQKMLRMTSSRVNQSDL